MYMHWMPTIATLSLFSLPLPRFFNPPSALSIWRLDVALSTSLSFPIWLHPYKIGLLNLRVRAQETQENHLCAEQPVAQTKRTKNKTRHIAYRSELCLTLQ